jgi:hypothetical protein
VKRWLSVVLGVGLAAAALHALLARPPGGASRSAHDDIDASSRAQLDQVLRRADAEDRP